MRPATSVTTGGELDMNEGEVKEGSAVVNELIQYNFHDCLFVSCLIFSIIFMIAFGGVVSYLCVLFKNYLDSLA